MPSATVRAAVNVCAPPSAYTPSSAPAKPSRDETTATALDITVGSAPRKRTSSTSRFHASSASVSFREYARQA